jgi:hypothetical protein
MFTYLRQPRRIVASEPFPDFPIQCEIELRLAPPQTFGAGEGPIRAIRLGSDFSLLWDANNDLDLSQPKPGFERMQIESAALDGMFVLSGDRLTYSFLAASAEEMLRVVQFLQFAVPPALGSRLPNPIHLLQIGGKVGSVPFSVQHSRSVTPVVVLTDDGLRGRIEAGIATIAFVATEESGRVLAATRYVHDAARLLATGHSPWEFMAEALLNSAKALEVLFDDSRDEQRQGLRSVGMANTDIEGRYIPVTLLRDMLDVAHPQLSLFSTQTDFAHYTSF